MSRLVLHLGNRNFSSWSLRAWLTARLAGAELEERFVYFDEDEDRVQRRRFGPTGKVPVLTVDDFPIWDSLAIAEFFAERHPSAGLWPAQERARWRARSLAAEMHSGFPALRSELPMNCRARTAWRDRGPEVDLDIARITAAWAETRAAFGTGGAFLFGKPTIADAFFAPVASRFLTYGVPLTGAARDYVEALLALEPMRAWLAAAADEGHEVETYAQKL